MDSRKVELRPDMLLAADSYVAKFIHFTSAATHDQCLFPELSLEAGDMICFDKSYIDSTQFYDWSQQGIYLVTRMKENAVYEVISELDIPDTCDHGVIKDELIQVTTKSW